ncbi:MAG: DUF2782 domain-containing protein [Betaproteobacteria bacterium]|nr:DUF2782 domain-containing protein [Betaproteobacteria bacterium]
MRLRLLFSLILLAAAPAFAQDKPANLEPLPDTQPPPMPQGVDEDEAPEITITTRGEDRVEEYRIHGALYMIRVTPRVGAPYYLIDAKGNGVFSRFDPANRQLSVPMWVLRRW